MKGAALITGAARRVGARLAVALAQEGFDVALHHRGGGDEAQGVAREIRALGRRCEVLTAELTDAAARDALVDRAAVALGPLRVLVNNASMFGYDTLQTLEETGWSAHLASNLTAPVFLARRFAAQVSAPGALVVNLSDFKVFSPNPDHFSYTAGKIALTGLTAPMAMALAPDVRVCGLAPGLTLPSGPQTDADFRAAQATLPTPFGPTMDDLAEALRFMLRTPSYNGQVLTVDGAESLLRRPRDVAYAAG